MDQFNESALRFGTLDGFDDLNDMQQHIILVLAGMIMYNTHMKLEVEVKKGVATVTMGKRGQDWSNNDPETSKYIDRMLDLISPFKELADKVKYKKGNRFFTVSA